MPALFLLWILIQEGLTAKTPLLRWLWFAGALVWLVGIKGGF